MASRSRLYHLHEVSVLLWPIHVLLGLREECDNRGLCMRVRREESEGVDFLPRNDGSNRRRRQRHLIDRGDCLFRRRRGRLLTSLLRKSSNSFPRRRKQS